MTTGRALWVTAPMQEPLRTCAQASTVRRHRACDSARAGRRGLSPPIRGAGGTRSGACSPSPPHGSSISSWSPCALLVPQITTEVRSPVEVMPPNTNRGPAVAGGRLRLGGRRPVEAACRDEVAASLGVLWDRTGQRVFAVREVYAKMLAAGTRHAESTVFKDDAAHEGTDGSCAVDRPGADRRRLPGIHRDIASQLPGGRGRRADYTLRFRGYSVVRRRDANLIGPTDQLVIPR
jgi:hypothetical protein